MQTSQFQIAPPADYAGPRFDSLEHQRHLARIAESRRRSNAIWAATFAVLIGVAAVLVAYVAILEVAHHG